MEYKSSTGSPTPMGATRDKEGVNFALFATDATSITLCLYHPDSGAPLTSFPMTSRTGKVWHIHVANLPAHTQYTYIVDGPHEPHRALFHAKDRHLLDPYAQAVASHPVWGERENGYHPRGVTDASQHFDWQDVTPPNIPKEELIIYEMHVRSFTKHASSSVTQPGTFAGIVQKIPYLKELGVNAIELMPVFEWDECSYQLPLQNYWGYGPMNFFAPMMRFCTGTGQSEQALLAITEFKTMVRELHHAGIEVILDVVYNHTGENAAHGPSISYRGLAPSTYYMMDSRAHFQNYSGCGNTLKCNAPAVRQLILQSLRYWVTEMHVDGFRFDLASIMTREASGAPMQQAPLVEAISQDPILADAKLIAEPWDPGGLYQVGQWPKWGDWSEWNGKYRDAVRRFIKGTPGWVGPFATSICGSEDIYGNVATPSASVNFVTSHDGFTLHDLVSYNHKHNEANGEQNRDGTDSNDSWNCGAEGNTRNQKIVTLRRRQMRNFILTLLISRGIPMLLMGDEYGHTRNGNNNAWCQDNDLNYFQWDHNQEELTRFTKELIAFRKRHPVLSKNKFYTTADITWNGHKPGKPNWSHESRFLSATIDNQIYVAFNAHYRTAKVTLPDHLNWHRIVDTALPAPQDFTPETDAPPVDTSAPYVMPPHSAILLIAN